MAFRRLSNFIQKRMLSVLLVHPFKTMHENLIATSIHVLLKHCTKSCNFYNRYKNNAIQCACGHRHQHFLKNSSRADPGSQNLSSGWFFLDIVGVRSLMYWNIMPILNAISGTSSKMGIWESTRILQEFEPRIVDQMIFLPKAFQYFLCWKFWDWP